jgi:KaiC/GvpD/RAD55 family RecA-like ATPase
VADGVISLRYLEMQSRNELMLSLRIIKMRRTEHSRKITPYSITNKGLEVHVGSEF